MVLGKRKAENGQSVADAAPVAKKQQQRSAHSSSKGKVGPVLGRAERAALRKERRASKPHHAIIENANQLYRFDFKRMDAAERRAKIAELMERTAGVVAEVLSKHDTSRVFQLMVKYGSGEQRQRLAEACKGSFVSLCVNHYAHHFVLKLLQYGSPVVRQAVWRELRGHVAQLAFHADGAVVFDYLFASEKSKRLQLDMTKELLHPSFALDAQTNAVSSSHSQSTTAAAGGGGSMAELCASQPAIAASMVAHVGGLIEKWLNKNQLQYRFVHAIVRQYLELPAALLPRSVRAELISSLCSSPSLSALCASNDGVLGLCLLVSDGGAKDRKQVMRCLKVDALSVCRSLYGHLLLMRVVECVDDTVAVDKNVWSGLLSDPYAVSQLLNDVHGAKVVRFMLHGKSSTHFLSPFEAAFQRQAQPSLTTLTEEGGSSSSGGSKKDSVLRHEEHLAHCLLPLLSVFQLDEFVRDHPPALTAAQLAAQASAAGTVDKDEDDAGAVEQQPAGATSLDSLLRSPAASPVLLELLHTAQATMAAADVDIKAAALSALRSQLKPAIEAALDKLALVVQQQQQHTEQHTTKDEQRSEDQPPTAGGLRGRDSDAAHSSLLEDRTAHYFFKRLLAPNAQLNAAAAALRSSTALKQQQPIEAESSSPSASATQLAHHFAEQLLQTVRLSPAVLSAAAASNRGCFVLLALIDALDEVQQRELAQLCRQHNVHTAIDAAVQQYDEQQKGQPMAAATSRKRKRANRNAETSAATAAAPEAGSSGSSTSGTVMAGCRLLRAWIDSKQVAAASTKGKAPKETNRQPQEATLSTMRAAEPDGSTAAVSKRSRSAAKRR